MGSAGSAGSMLIGVTYSLKCGCASLRKNRQVPLTEATLGMRSNRIVIHSLHSPCFSSNSVSCTTILATGFVGSL